MTLRIMYVLIIITLAFGLFFLVNLRTFIPFILGIYISLITTLKLLVGIFLLPPNQQQQIILYIFRLLLLGF